MANKEEQKQISALRRRRKLRQLLGAVISVLVVVGLVSTIMGAVNLIKVLTDDTAELQAYASRISTLVAFDPVPFNSLEEADQNLLLEACIWRVIDEDPDRYATYEEDEMGSKYMPIADVQMYAEELYGPEYTFTYDTFTSSDITYTYVAEKEAYLLPVTGLTGNYYPEAVKMDKQGKTQRVTIAYISPYTNEGAFTATPDLTPKKYYDYIFTRQDTGYFLTAIVESDMKVAASSSSSQANSVLIYEPQDNQNVLTDTKPDESIPTDSSSTTIGESTEATVGASQEVSSGETSSESQADTSATSSTSPTGATSSEATSSEG